MRKGFLGSILTLVAGSGLTLAQSPPPAPVPPASAAAAPAAATADGSTLLAGFFKHKEAKKEAKKGNAAEAKAACPPEPKCPEPGVSVPDGPNAFEGMPDGGPKTRYIDNQDYYPCSHLWASTEYLAWWTRNGPSPGPIVTTGTGTSTGLLGQVGTIPVIGGHNFDYDTHTGARWSIGYSAQDAFDSATLGFEVSGFVLDKRSDHESVQSDATGAPFLVRPVSQPITDPTTGAVTFQQTTQQVAGPGAFAGGVTLDTSSRLWGAEANVVASKMLFGPDLIVGFRYLNLEEGLDINQNTAVLPLGQAGFNGTTVLAPDRLLIHDRFGTRNEFYGGQVGLQNESRNGKFYLYVSSKVAVGTSHETSDIRGDTTLFSGGTVSTTNGGNLALRSNIGVHDHNEVAVVPELGVTVGCDVTHFCRIFAGYNNLYWSDVARPGDQVSRFVNPALVPSSQQFGTGMGPNVPAAPVHSTDFWAQGFNVGVAFRY